MNSAGTDEKVMN